MSFCHQISQLLSLNMFLPLVLDIPTAKLKVNMFLPLVLSYLIKSRKFYTSTDLTRNWNTFPLLILIISPILQKHILNPVTPVY